MRKFTLLVSMLALPLVFASCAGTQSARKVETSGFLNDYSILKRTKGEVAQLAYIRENTDWAGYTKVMIEPISLWRVPGSPLEKAPKNELETVAQYFYQALTEQLGEEFELVDEPSTGTLKIRAAITEAEKSVVILDGLSTIVPVGFGASAAKKLATGTHAFVGKAAGELEIRSAATDELLSAVVSSRVGGKGASSKKFSSWGDVQLAADEWASSIRDRLVKLRSGQSQIEFAE